MSKQRANHTHTASHAESQPIYVFQISQMAADDALFADTDIKGKRRTHIIGDRVAITIYRVIS